jgi:hypothetical protein
VLAHLKTITEIWQEWYVPGSDGREGRVTAKGPLPRPVRNGLPEARPYVYRGTGESLPGWRAARALGVRGPVPAEPVRKAPERATCPDCRQPKPDHLRGCSQAPVCAPSDEGEPGGERDILDLIDEEVARITPGHIEERLRETLRRVGAAPSAEAAPEPEPAAEPAKRCRKCTYPADSIGHKTACGEKA